MPLAGPLDDSGAFLFFVVPNLAILRPPDLRLWSLMTTFGVDYAFEPHPSISALTRAKVKFVARYLSPYASKNLTADEAKRLRAAGIAVVAVWESTAKRAEDGKAAGIADAQVAERLLKSIGAPNDMPVYFAVDYDTVVGPRVTAYFQGVASVIGKGRTGVYGGYKVVKGCFDAKLVTWGWQTYAWSGGKWDDRAQIQQYSNNHTIGSGGVDYNRAVGTKYGQWPAERATSTPSKPSKPAGAPIPSPKLSVDGLLGRKTVEALQAALNYRRKASLACDGVLGAQTVGELQEYIGVRADGVLGPATARALQKRVGTMPDGGVGPATVKALQKMINAGKF